MELFPGVRVPSKIFKAKPSYFTDETHLEKSTIFQLRAKASDFKMLNPNPAASHQDQNLE